MAGAQQLHPSQFTTTEQADDKSALDGIARVSSMQLEPVGCSSEWQIVQCGQIPFEAQEERQRCCAAYRPFTPSARVVSTAAVSAAAAAAQAAQTPLERPDLTNPPSQPDFSCLARAPAEVPVFDGQNPVRIEQQLVPQMLSRATIQAVKAKAITKLSESVAVRYNQLRKVNAASGFVHPAGIAGPAELALMIERLAAAAEPQASALGKLLNGTGVPPKTYPPQGWYPPINCPPSGYQGPYPMTTVAAGWGGSSSGNCPANYPAGAPPASCAHISFVELDAQMAYKQALAFWATGNTGHAETALRILEGWATTNKVWGVLSENGPLEAGWGLAAMARAMELLKYSGWPGFKQSTADAFVAWANNVLMPQMEHFVYTITAKVISLRIRFPHNLNNWHSTIAEAWVAFGILSDDRDRYEKGVRLYHHTVNDYLKFGRQDPYKAGRIVGECTETMRDIYHSEFGLGGLLQTAEIAWGQDEDLYSSGAYALAAAMELHARIINAGNDSSLLPPGFKFLQEMPSPPAGTEWAFDMQKQLWYARDKASGVVASWLTDGIRWVVGSKFLPTGWELGYNHFVHRLGMNLPETAKLISRYWPDYFEFHWGLGTLTHANTAVDLWRPGIDSSTLCGS